MNIVVTGGRGQLALCLKDIVEKDKAWNVTFVDRDTLDITDSNEIEDFFDKYSVDYCINCAAYTNVELAETEPDQAFAVNAEGVKNLAIACKRHGITLIHISTDYVFDGKKKTPYTEEDVPNPLNIYGKSKLAGECYVQELLEHYFIIRTSWLYSQYGKNFYTTMLKLFDTKDKLEITTAQTGTPTNANDLAEFLFFLIENNLQAYGIYHYSNLGEATWYDFAKAILEQSGKEEHIRLEKTDNYATFAKRPKYSVLSKEMYIKTFDMTLCMWDLSLRKIRS